MAVQQRHSLSCLMTPGRIPLFPALLSIQYWTDGDTAAGHSSLVRGTRKREREMLPEWNRGSQEGPQHRSGRCLGRGQDGGFEERSKGRRLKMSSNVKMQKSIGTVFYHFYCSQNDLFTPAQSKSLNQSSSIPFMEQCSNGLFQRLASHYFWWARKIFRIWPLERLAEERTPQI